MKIHLLTVLGLNLVLATQSFAGDSTTQPTSCERFTQDYEATAATCDKFKKGKEDQSLVAECEEGIAQLKNLMAKASCPVDGSKFAH